MATCNFFAKKLFLAVKLNTDLTDYTDKNLSQNPCFRAKNEIKVIIMTSIYSRIVVFLLNLGFTTITTSGTNVGNKKLTTMKWIEIIKRLFF